MWSDYYSSFAAMANLLHYRKKSRSLVECFLQTQNNPSLLMTLSSPRERMEWFWPWTLLTLVVSEGPWTIEMGAIYVGLIPVSLKTVILPWCEGSSVKAMLCYCCRGGAVVIGGWSFVARPAQEDDGARATLPQLWYLLSAACLASSTNSPCSSIFNAQTSMVESDLMAWSVSSIRPVHVVTERTSKKESLLPRKSSSYP